ncbi:hypothetical protein CVV38_01590 [Candidatus Peregrinibacteria bacterium HGW-Peregrinibacteria-1]|jgi:L-ascorbate metabolism protein UlaG (beta-lactamase superfamily)|nr:MAG: hypothetical protein CVV38_01590 [Candidatus Peregrinibacteria bacterium HGW-Peregrinibacteria-1]
MELTYHGDTTLKVTGKKATVLLNPKTKNSSLTADLVISNLPDDQLAVPNGITKIFSWPGEYEANEVPIQGLDIRRKDGSLNTVFFFTVDGIHLCHLGNIDTTLQKEELNTIGDVDILMINIGDDLELSTKDAIELIESIEPRILLFMGHNYEQSPVLKELELTNIEKKDKFTLKDTSELPESDRLDIALNAV